MSLSLDARKTEEAYKVFERVGEVVDQAVEGTISLNFTVRFCLHADWSVNRRTKGRIAPELGLSVICVDRLECD